jgi:cytidine deaminase
MSDQTQRLDRTWSLTEDRFFKEAHISPQLLSELEASARIAGERSYSPYSRFAVGAAVLTSSGKMFSGCNVENASYGLTNCAERTAVFKAVSEGECSITAVAVYTPTSSLTPPCGACRQVLYEFGPQCFIISCGLGEGRLLSRLDLLLPGAFGPGNL